MKIRLNSLFVKLPLSIVTFIVLLLTAVGTYFYYETLNEHKVILERIAPEIADEIAFTTKEIIWNFETKSIKNIIKFEMNNPSVKTISLSINSLYQDDNKITDEKYFIAYERVGSSIERTTQEPKGDYIIAQRDVTYSGEKIAIVKVFLTNKHLAAEFNRKVMNIALFCIVLTLLVTFIIFLQLKSFVITPMKRMMDAINKIQRGDLSIRIPIFSQDEFGELSESFNKNTEVRQDAEIQLKTKNEELRNIVHVASHDLRTPLVNIDGFTQELKYSIDSLKKLSRNHSNEKVGDSIGSIQEDCSEYFESITASVSYMGSLIEGLLNLSRTGQKEIKKQRISMNDLFERVIETQRNALSTNQIQLDLDDLPECYGDEFEISRVVQNLLANAIKYRDESRRAQIKISGVIEENFNIYSVADNGCGISEFEVRKIFDSFYRGNVKNHDGEGIGLSIANIIVMKHSGKLWVESEPNKGSTFYFRLPVK